MPVPAVNHKAYVLLEDGVWFEGTTRHPFSVTPGEVVFTTNLSGYQEVFTDPSYLGQVVVMTAPMIGNYGVNDEDLESANRRPAVSGIVVRELSRTYSNWRAQRGLDDWLAEQGVPVIEGVDTRRLARHIRSEGAMKGIVALGEEPDSEAQARLDESPSMVGLDLASKATGEPTALPLTRSWTRPLALGFERARSYSTMAQSKRQRWCASAQAASSSRRVLCFGIWE